MTASDVLLLLAPAAGALGALALWRHRQRRRRRYAALARRRDALAPRYPPRVVTPIDPGSLHAAFDARRIVRVDGFVDGPLLGALQDECLAARTVAERSYVPAHKKGGTLSYEAMHRHAPNCLALFHSTALRDWLSALVGAPLQVTADHDQSACSLLYYDQAGDHIGWHYDHNFYRGRHFTVLLSLINRSPEGGPSRVRLQHRHDETTDEIDTPANSLVVFEGARVLHRATPAAPGDERVLLSMTFCTDSRIRRGREWIRRIKDTAYFGPRALID